MAVARRAPEIVDAINRAIGISLSDHEERRRLIFLLGSFRKKFEADMRIAIVLSKLYADNNDYDNAESLIRAVNKTMLSGDFPSLGNFATQSKRLGRLEDTRWALNMMLDGFKEVALSKELIAMAVSTGDIEALEHSTRLNSSLAKDAQQYLKIIDQGKIRDVFPRHQQCIAQLIGRRVTMRSAVAILEDPDDPNMGAVINIEYRLLENFSVRRVIQKNINKNLSEIYISHGLEPAQWLGVLHNSIATLSIDEDVA
ncbi:hypothetical protein [Ferrovibrio sp.]|uniref:hypothetical protein n=1 Tax=Ferrovibrio sp. TaxID=1917215 RepID=UPI003D0C987A